MDGEWWIVLFLRGKLDYFVFPAKWFERMEMNIFDQVRRCEKSFFFWSQFYIREFYFLKHFRRGICWNNVCWNFFIPWRIKNSWQKDHLLNKFDNPWRREKKDKYFVTYRLRERKNYTTISMLFNVPASEADLRTDLLACRLRNTEEEKKTSRLHVSSFLLPFFSSLFFFILGSSLLLLLLQKFRLPGKSWDPIIRVSSIVMQITITNRRQGRSPDDIAGKESSWIPSTRGRILFSTWHPGSPRGSFEDRGSEKKVVATLSSTGRSTSSTRVLLLNSLQLTIKILVTSSSSLCARVTCTTVSFKNIVGGGGGEEIVVLIWVEKRYEAKSMKEEEENYFVEIDGGYVLFRDIGEKNCAI